MVKKLKEFSIFGGKKYFRSKFVYARKNDAINDAKRMRAMGFDIVRDKNSEGHFLWMHSKPVKSEKGSTKKDIPSMEKIIAEAEKGPDSFLRWRASERAKDKGVPKEFREKFNSIKKEYDRLDRTPKKELVKIVQGGSKLDMSHIKKEDRYSIRNYILQRKYGRRLLEKFDKYNK